MVKPSRSTVISQRCAIRPALLRSTGAWWATCLRPRTDRGIGRSRFTERVRGGGSGARRRRRRFARRRARGVGERASGSFTGTIAIDDVHLVANDESCAALLERLVAGTTSNVRWISPVAEPESFRSMHGSETVPPRTQPTKAVPALTREEALGVARKMNPRAPAEDVDALVGATSGWAAALCVALQLRGREPNLLTAMDGRASCYTTISRCKSTDRFPRKSASFSTIAVLLPEIDGAVLEAAGFAGARATLRGLHRRLSFLSPIAGGDGTAEQYRCHDLFRDYLVRRFDLLDVASRTASRMRAAAALESCGHSPGASVVCKLQRPAETLGLLETHAYDLARRGHADTLAFVLASVPSESGSSAAVLGTRGHLAYLDCKYEEAVALLDRAVTASGNALRRAQLLVIWAVAKLRIRENPTQRLRPAAQDGSLPQAIRAELVSLVLLAYALHDPEAAVDELFDEAERLAESPGMPAAVRSHTLTRLGKAASWRGKSSRAELLAGAAELSTKACAHREAATAYDGLSAEEFGTGNYAEALRYAELSEAAARKSGDSIHVVWGLSQRVAAYFMMGMRTELHEALERLEPFVSPHDPDFAFGTGRGSKPRGMAISQRRIRIKCAPVRRSTSGKDECSRLARGGLFAADGNAQEAERFARDALAHGESKDWSRPTCRRYFEMGSALCAIAFLLAGNRVRARRLTARRTKAVTPPDARCSISPPQCSDAEPSDDRAYSEGYRALHERSLDGYVLLLEALRRKLPRERPGSDLLAPAKLDVLASLGQGLTPKLVASERDCSVHTVRKHIARIVRKLQCKGYRQAVRVARERGISRPGTPRPGRTSSPSAGRLRKAAVEGVKALGRAREAHHWAAVGFDAGADLQV